MNKRTEISYALADQQTRKSSDRQAGREPRHCWVRDPAYPMKLPGIVLRWEQGPIGWEALVVYAVPDRDAVNLRWLPDDLLEPG